MLYDVVPDNFFSPLSSPGRTVYWECIKRLFAITGRQLSFGVERDVLVDDGCSGYNRYLIKDDR